MTFPKSNKRFISFFIFAILGSITLYAQNNNFEFEKDYEVLEKCESVYGENSSHYLNSLLIFAQKFHFDNIPDLQIFLASDYYLYVEKLSNILMSKIEIIKAFYGIDSEEYRLALVYLNGTLLGKYFEGSRYNNYSKSVIEYLEALEHKIKEVKNNDYEFLSILTCIYSCYDIDYQKSLFLHKLKYDIAKRKYGKDSQEFGYSITHLILANWYLGNQQEANKLISEYIKTCKGTSIQRPHEISILLNNMPIDTNKNICELLLREYAYGFGNINDIFPLIQKWWVAQMNDRIELIEKWIIPYQDEENLFEYYKGIGRSIGDHNPLKALEYINNAIEISNEKSCYITSTNEASHLFADVAVIHQRRNDNKAAALNYLYAANALKKSLPNHLEEIQKFYNLSGHLFSLHYKSLDNIALSIIDSNSFINEYIKNKGNLKGLYNLYHEFIRAKDMASLAKIELLIMEGYFENETEKVVRFYVDTAEHMQLLEDYATAAYYHLGAITYSKKHNQPLLAYEVWEQDGLRHCRWENFGYCAMKSGSKEDFAKAIFSCYNSVCKDFGEESPEAKYYYDFLFDLFSSKEFGSTMEKFLQESN